MAPPVAHARQQPAPARTIANTDSHQRATGTWAFARLNLFALVLTAFWTPLNTLLLPDIVGKHSSEVFRASALGLVALVGVGVAVLTQPYAGWLSDRARSGQRRRLPMAMGAAVAAMLAVALWFAPNLATLMLVYILLQIAMNAAQAAFQALIPETVASGGQSRASGIKTALDVGGNAVGLAVAGVMVLAGAPTLAVLVALAGICLAGSLATILGVPRSKPGDRPRVAIGSVFSPLRSASPEFRHAIVMRFLFMLSIYPVLRFILYLLEDRYDVADPLSSASLYIIVAILVAAAGGLAAGVLDDHFATGVLVRVSAWMAAGALLGIAIAPTLWLLAAPAMVLALAAGAFQALNWGTLSKSMPGEEAGRYFGLANVATAGASAISGIFGPLVDIMREYVPGATYQVLFVLCAIIAAAVTLPRWSADERKAQEPTPR